MHRMDNGPESISMALTEWVDKYAVKLHFIQPGKPTQDAFIERFNQTYRTQILDFYLFRTPNEVREITDKCTVWATALAAVAAVASATHVLMTYLEKIYNFIKELLH